MGGVPLPGRGPGGRISRCNAWDAGTWDATDAAGTGSRHAAGTISRALAERDVWRDTLGGRVC